MPAALNMLNAYRLSGIVQGLQDVRQAPNDLLFLNRTRIVPATDAEIMARITGDVYIADLIGDDQRAVVSTPDQIAFESTAAPNIKHGSPLTQAQINVLLAAMTGGADGELWNDYETSTIDKLLLGVQQRMEALLVCMAMDTLNYDRLGIKLSNVTWGMPSDLKVTSAIDWSNAATATPVNDLLTLQLIGSARHGQTFNRATMSTTALQKMIATTEFQEKAKLYLPAGIGFGNLATANLTQQTVLASNVVGMAIEIYDSRYRYPTTAGTRASAPYLPIEKIILSNTADDNNPAVSDFANGITTESVVASMVDSPLIGGRFNGPMRGPIAYCTGVPDLNPPQLTIWAVARGFPRKHLLEATAVLTAGSGWTDSIPVLN